MSSSAEHKRVLLRYLGVFWMAMDARWEDNSYAEAPLDERYVLTTPVSKSGTIVIEEAHSHRKVRSVKEDNLSDRLSCP